MKNNRFLVILIILGGLSSYSLGQPTIITLPPDSISTSSAILHAICYPNGEETEVHFHNVRVPGCHGDGSGIFFLKQYVPANVESQEVSLLVTGLTANANYYSQAGAKYLLSTEYFHGEEVAFVTPGDPSAKGFAIPFYSLDKRQIVHTRTFGVHTHATSCLDYCLGEFELPPFPPGGGDDYRFVNPNSSSNSCFGLGSYQDLREYRDSTQIDTFKLHFQPFNGIYPVIFSWPNLSNNYKGSVRLVDMFNGIVVNVDMKKQNSFELSANLNDLLIIAEGPTNLISANFDYDYSFNNIVIVNASFNPGGVPTQAWFEWGLTNAYGSNTLKKYIGNDTTLIQFSDSIKDTQQDSIYHYRVVIENANGTIYGIDQTFAAQGSITDVGSSLAKPERFHLYQNYPNPFNPQTTIEYELPEMAHVKIVVYNVLGQNVQTLIDGIQNPGRNQVEFKATGLPSGVYFYQLHTGLFFDTKKMLMMK